ncbi:hypothetical protein GS489_02050 [Rhodococcus hoagii]|nr:hypothetical protein [Prescottella equi]MBM4613736.1 hypothetical protein [Prescottella equi]
MVALISTDFTQPDGLLSTPDWLLVSGSTGYPRVTSGEAGAQSVSGTSNTYSVIYNEVLDSDDMEVTGVVGTPAVGATGTSIAYSILWLGVANQSTAGSSGTVTNGAYVQFRPGQSSGANSLSIGTVIGGSAVTRANAASTVNFAVGDTITFRRVGDTYTVLVNGTGVCSWSDSANLLARNSANRSVGMRFASASASIRSTTLDSFTAKALTPAPPQLVGVSSAFASSASTTVSCTYPAASASGDLLVMFAGYQRTTTGAMTIATPAGWNRIDEDIRPVGSSTNYMAAVTFWRIRDAETSVSVVASTSASTYGTVQIHAYRGAINPSAPIEASAITFLDTTGSGARTFPAVSTTARDCAISYFISIEKTLSGTLTFGGAGPIEGSNPFERIDGYCSAGDLIFGSATALQTNPGSTGTVTVTPSAGSNESQLAVVAIRSQYNQNLADSDASGSATETASTTALVKPSDTGTGTETATQAVRIPTDTGTGTESQSTTALATPADTGSGTESQSTTALVKPSDTGTGTETAVVSNTVLASDTGSGTDAISPLGVRIPADIGTGTETQSTTALVKPSDTGTAVETAIGGSNVPTSDTVPPASESTAIRIQASDTGKGVESAAIGSVVFGSDTARGTDTASVAVRADGDTGTGTEHAFKSRSGILDTPRLLTVPKDDRRFVVERENRTVTVEGEVRRIWIGKDLSPRSKMPHRDSRTLGIPADERVLVITREE